MGTCGRGRTKYGNAASAFAAADGALRGGAIGFVSAAATRACGSNSFVQRRGERCGAARDGRRCATISQAARIAPCMQGYSDSRTLIEYMNYLEGGGDEGLPRDQPAVIVGGGRIGSLLASLGNPENPDIVVRRGEPVPQREGPIYICTRNDDLEAVIEATPQEKRGDLVFLQNGMLDPLLRKYGLMDNSRVNVYFAVAKLGAKPVDGITTTNPEGLTAATGRWSQAIAERLARAELSCRVLQSRDFTRSMFEKLIWISAVMLIGSVHGNIPVGQVAEKHAAELEEMVDELARMVRFTARTALLGGVPERIAAYCRAVPDFPTALKEFKWRNGYFYHYTQLARKNNFDDPTPMHTDYLEDGKAKGLIDWTA
mmetsp:Transcript_7602/g.20193  ORF Transcript_7602/g.20193 Transcript_7602/m.20193 type:complete len:371 (+) Transcript_7602:58-1170(+)